MVIVEVLYRNVSESVLDRLSAQLAETTPKAYWVSEEDVALTFREFAPRDICRFPLLIVVSASKDCKHTNAPKGSMMSLMLREIGLPTPWRAVYRYS